MDRLGGGDEVALLSFTGNNSPPVTRHRARDGGRFTNDPDGFDDTLRVLAGTEGGGTPLYDAIIDAVDYTVTYGRNRNRAVLVFTDGDDTSSSASIDDAVDAARNANVPLHTVSLGSGTDLNVLTRLASATGGSLAYAADARQLISYYGALGRFLSGAADYYRTTWMGTITGGSSSFGPGGWLRTGVTMNTPSGQRLYAPFRIDFPAGVAANANAERRGCARLRRAGVRRQSASLDLGVRGRRGGGRGEGRGRRPAAGAATEPAAVDSRRLTRSFAGIGVFR